MNEDLKSNKGNLTHPPPPPPSHIHTHRLNMIELYHKKKVATPTPHFYINPPPSFTGLCPLFSKKNSYRPQSDSVFRKSFHPPPNF